MRSVDHMRFQKLEISDVGVLLLELDHFPDLLELAADEWAVGVALAVDKGQHGVCFLPAALTGKPAWRLWHKEHGGKESDCWDHLQAPWDTERGGAFSVGRTVRQIEHYHDTPGDCPLLGPD